MRPFRSPVWIPERAPPLFPDPRDFEPSGLIAGGGDLSRQRLLAAYRSGIFPWYDEEPILWWSPDPRAIINPDSLHISRSLRRRLKSDQFSVTCNHATAEVLHGCAQREEGTWLNAKMKAAYLELAEYGHLVSYEVWDQEQQLVGGLYGVLVGGLFAAESKFHRATDASKVALVAAVTDLFSRGVALFDVQFTTDHLMSLGVHNISREEYLARLRGLSGPEVVLALPGTNILPQLRRQLEL